MNTASRHAVLWCEMYNGAKEVVSLASLYLAHNLDSLLYVFLLSRVSRNSYKPSVTLRKAQACYILPLLFKK